MTIINGTRSCALFTRNNFISGKPHRFLPLVLALAVTACGDDDDKSPAPSAADSTITSVSEEFPGDNCEHGGSRQDQWIDDNGDGLHQAGETNDTQYNCNSAPVINGDGTITSTRDEFPGENCALGGKREETWIDKNNDGLHQDNETISTAFECTQPPGSGENAIVTTISEEFPGDNCTLGGSREDKWVDENGDSLLQHGEIVSTVYNCNKQPAPNAPAGFALNLQPAKRFIFNWLPDQSVSQYRLYQDVDGTSGYEHLVDLAGDSAGHELAHPLFNEGLQDARYILEACNDDNLCTSSDLITVDQPLEDAIGVITHKSPINGDMLGASLSVSDDGTVMAIGSPRASGSIQIYHLIDGEWVRKPELNGPNNREQFGHTVHVSGDGQTIVAAYHDEESNVYADIYKWNNDGYWEKDDTVGTVFFNEGNDTLEHIISVSEDGNCIALGGDLHPSPHTPSINTGAVAIFSREGGSWFQEATVAPELAEKDDEFGGAVAISDDCRYLVAGAIREDGSGTGNSGDETDNSLESVGAAYVFFRNDNGEWIQHAYLKPANSGANLFFGKPVAISGDGNVVAITARGESSDSVGVNGNITSYSESYTVGATYAFHRNGTDWYLHATLKPHTNSNDIVANANFGGSLSITDDGNHIAIGMKGEHGDGIGINPVLDPSSIQSKSGSAYVFERVNGQWQHKAYLKSKFQEANQGFGHAVCYSGDGNTLAISAVYKELLSASSAGMVLIH